MRTFLSLLALLALALPVDARPRGGSFAMPSQNWSNPAPAVVAPVPAPAPATTQTSTAPAATAPTSDALAQVNALRAARGLQPYQLDPNLNEAAKACAAYRAQYRIAGHTSSDFAFVPAGSSASAAGCAAWPMGSGFGSCCIYDGYRYAGAATVLGADGKEYHHLFVR
jgi:hypothetical protein